MTFVCKIESNTPVSRLIKDLFVVSGKLCYAHVLRRKVNFICTEITTTLESHSLDVYN
jgi:hypothetical protein